MEGALNMHEPEEHNIGNWHWEEKDFTEWAKKTLKEQFTFEQALNDTTTIDVTVDSIKGEVFKYVRKNKLRYSFDITIKADFTYNDAGKDIVRGIVVYEPFCDDDDPEDWDFAIYILNREVHVKEDIDACLRNVTRAQFYPRFQLWLKDFEKEM